MRSFVRSVSYLACAALVGCQGSSSSPPAPPPPTPVAIEIAGDASPNGIFDPSVVSAGGGVAWMAYSSVHYYGDPLVQDVGVRIARSADGGLTWTYAATVAEPSAAIVVDPDAANHTLCGQATCSGRWVYETSWLVQDPTDVPARRWKLFAHQYFLRPANPPLPAAFYHLGAIVMWTATSPEQLGASPPGTALRWTFTPETVPVGTLSGGTSVNGLAPALSSCLAVAEGGATGGEGGLDVVLACSYPVPGADPLPQKIVLLRSTDHAATFQYVATLLDAPDASGISGASFFTAPALLPTEGAAPVLIVTPMISRAYAGCDVIPFADEGAGTLARQDGKPRLDLTVPVGAGIFGGACAYDRGLAGMGLLVGEVDLSQSPPMFRILRTGLVP